MQSAPANAGSASDGDQQAERPYGEMLKRAIVVDTEKVRGHLDEVVRSTGGGDLEPAAR